MLEIEKWRLAPSTFFVSSCSLKLCLVRLRRQKKWFARANHFSACRDDRIWTCDHSHPMRVRYQTAPHPGHCWSSANDKFQMTNSKIQYPPSASSMGIYPPNTPEAQKEGQTEFIPSVCWPLASVHIPIAFKAVQGTNSSRVLIHIPSALSLQQNPISCS